MSQLTAKVILTFKCPSCGETMKLDFNRKPVVTCIFADCELEGVEFLPPEDADLPGAFVPIKTAR